MMQFRQVRHPILKYRVVETMSYNEIVGHYLTVQQKWLIGSHYVQGEIKGISFIEEWRDLPVVEAKDA